jgi:hypothetical protein
MLKNKILIVLKALFVIASLFGSTGFFDLTALCDSHIDPVGGNDEKKPKYFSLVVFLVFVSTAVVSLVLLRYGITPETSTVPPIPPIQIFDPNPEKSEGLLLKMVREFLEWVDNRRGGGR